MRRIIFSLVGAAFSVIFVPARAPAAIIISTETGTGKDTYVQGNGTTGPTAATLSVKADNSTTDHNNSRKAWIGLDLSSIPANQNVTQATFTLTVAPTGAGASSGTETWNFAVYGLTDQTQDNWPETAATTWATAPGNLDTHDSADPGKTTLLGTFSLTGAGNAGDTVSIGGQPLVDFINADTNDLATFIVVRTTPADFTNTVVHGFAAKEHATLAAPTLSVEVPEPGVAASLLLVAGAALWRRRR